jgi:DNA-binding Lrp family transcriptional regulator
MYELNEVDRKILRELEKDAKRSLRQISRSLGISVTTLSSRILKMEKSGLIRGYSVLLDPEAAGFDLTAIIEIVVSKGKLMEVEREIAKMRNVFAVYDVTGLTDAVIIAKFRKRSDMNRFIKSLLSMRYIERTNTHLALNVVKEDMRLGL